MDSGGSIHPSDVRILASECSVAFAPATGRPLHSVRRVFERHGLFAGHPIPFPLILGNGTTVYAAYEKPLLRRSFEPDLRNALMRAVLSSTQASFLLHSHDEIHTLRPTEALEEQIQRFDLRASPFDPDGNTDLRALSKVAATARDPQTLRAFEAAVSNLPLERAYSLPNLLELTPTGVHKGLGLTALLQNTPGAWQEVIVAGDGENDLPLFDLATLTFAPSDSPPAIRNRADRVLDTRKQGLLAPMLKEIAAR